MKRIHLNNLIIIYNNNLTYQEDTIYQNYFVNNFVRNNKQWLNKAIIFWNFSKKVFFTIYVKVKIIYLIYRLVE